MNTLEREVMGFLLRGEHPILKVLREQFETATVLKREYTGVGFFTYFSVPERVQRLETARRMVLGDVYAEIEGLQYGAGFLLFVENGALDNLECFIFEDAWPAEAQIRRLYYVHPKEPAHPSLVEVANRDIDFALGITPVSRL